MNQRPNDGFTLIELMVTLVVFAILMTVAIPSFQQLRESNQVTSLSNELLTAIHLARSEAVKRGVVVSVCVDGNNWNEGWQVGVGTNCATQQVRVWPAAPGNLSVVSTGGNNAVQFSPLGARESGGATFTVGVAGNERQITVSSGGSVSSCRDCDE